jgi:hypothetical protein
LRSNIFYQITDDKTNWLRAHARYGRWMEELQIVENEMKWTLAWFSHQEKKWKERSEDAGGSGLEGHKCYAEKQLFIWGMMKKHFQDGWVEISKKQLE